MGIVLPERALRRCSVVGVAIDSLRSDSTEMIALKVGCDQMKSLPPGT